MTSAELSSEFDLLFENLTTGGNISLDEYEKSICLTKGQQKLAQELARQGDSLALTKISQIATLNSISDSTKYETAKTVIVPPTTDASFLLGVNAKGTSNGQTIDVSTRVVNNEVIDRLLMSAYQYPPKRVVYVVVGDLTESGKSIEVFPPLNFTVTAVNIRHYVNPAPIITSSISPETIDGNSAVTEPTLPEAYHRVILDYAVQYAVQTYIGIQEKEVGNGS